MRLTCLTTVLLTLPFATAQADPSPDGHAAPAQASQPATPPTEPSTTEPSRRDELLGKGWQSSDDRLLTTNGDATGFHVMVAEARTGYSWRTVATLSQPGVDADQWIGNTCVTGSGNRAVVVYAPRTFTNREALFGRGGYTATVDLRSGTVTRLPIRTTLAYYNPGCGVDETATLTQGADQDLGRTGVLTVDAATGTLSARTELPGQFTSAVPVRGGFVAADAVGLVRVDGNGTHTRLAETGGVPSQVRPDADGGVV
ncbi:hypothetical protein F0L68_37060, partial [Solihabitans fulvus]